MSSPKLDPTTPEPGFVVSADTTAPLQAPLHDQVLAGIDVLLVEDEDDTRELMAALLESYGARVRQAAEAKAAFEAFVHQPPDVIVSDIRLPGEDGNALLERIRSLPARAGGQVPAIAVTGYAEAADRARARRAGFAKCVIKPVQELTLVSVLATLLTPS